LIIVYWETHMKRLLLLAFVALTNIPGAWSSQKPLEITCDYYKTVNQEYGGNFLESEYIVYGNEKENNMASIHDYWVDLDGQRALSSGFDHIMLQPTKQGDLLVLSGEKVSESYSTYAPVGTAKITINLRTMEAQATHKEVHVYDGIDPKDLDSNHYLFLDGKCRYQNNSLGED